MWIKCLLQALKETYIAVKYGFIFYLSVDLRAVPTILCRKGPLTGARVVVPSWCPVPGLAVGTSTLVPVGSKWPCCGGAERQEWQRKMKTHKRSELEMEALACCAIPRKALQSEIDVLLPNEGAKNGNSRCTPAFNPGRCSFKHDKRGCVIPVLQSITCTLPRD